MIDAAFCFAIFSYANRVISILVFFRYMLLTSIVNMNYY